MLRNIIAGALVLGLLGLGGCSALGDIFKSGPGQEQSSVEEKALAAQEKIAEKLAGNLEALTNKVEFAPQDPDKPMVIQNAKATVRWVDSEVYKMIAQLASFAKYKSAPGFWSTLNNLIDRGVQLGEKYVPWWGATEMVKAAKPSQNTTNYDVKTEGTASPINLSTGGGTTSTAVTHNPTTSTITGTETPTGTEPPTSGVSQ